MNSLNKRYAYLAEISPNNSKYEPTICTQVLFNEDDLNYLKETERKYVEQGKDEEETVKKLEKKYKVKIEWKKIGEFEGYMVKL